MKRFILTICLLSTISIAKAEVALQLSAHHHYWDNAIGESSSHAPSFGVGLGYFKDRLFFTGAYTYSGHDRKRSNGDTAASFPLTEVDLGVGYHIATNIATFIGYHYQNIDNDNKINNNNSFYESGHGIGLGFKFNQMLSKSWVLHEGIMLSTLWMNNDHNSLSVDGYQDFSFNFLLGLMYRLTPKHSISFDVSYKGSSLTHSEDFIDDYRGYIKTGASIIIAF